MAHKCECDWRREFITSVQPAKAYEDESVTMSGSTLFPLILLSTVPAWQDGFELLQQQLGSDRSQSNLRRTVIAVVSFVQESSFFRE